MFEETWEKPYQVAAKDVGLNMTLENTGRTPETSRDICIAQIVEILCTSLRGKELIKELTSQGVGDSGSWDWWRCQRVLTSLHKQSSGLEA
jgi:hypothetical protein